MNLIVAMTQKRVIGKDNKLIWHIPEDLKNFKRLTTGHSVIMGRKTHESILAMLGKPLPNRNSIVLTRSHFFKGVTVCDSMDNAVKKAKEFEKNIFFIGGESIYKDSLPYIDTMYITWVKKEYTGDAFFPEIDFSNWEITENQEMNEFTFTKYQLNKS